MKSKLFPPGPASGFLGRRVQALNKRDPLGFMQEVVAQYGDIVHFKIGLQHVYLLNNPDHVKDVLNNHYQGFLKGRGFNRKNRFLGQGLITSEGEFHKRQRRRTQPFFHKERINDYANVMVNYTAQRCEQWENGQQLNIWREMRQLTMSVIAKTMFNLDTKEKFAEIERTINSSAEFKPFRLRLPRFLERLPIGALRPSRRTEVLLEAIVSRMIDERLRSTSDNGDLLTMLVREQSENSDLAETNQIRDEALTIFIAGYETNATALMWTWYLLAQYPEVEAKLHAELDQVLGSRLPTFDDFSKLSYTQQVYAEAMRLYPPAWRLVRYVKQEYEVAGYVLPKGSLVVVSQFLLHRDPRYFPDPLRFVPERWTPQAKASLPQYAYFPFGGGPRRCIGEMFSWMEGVLLLATVASRWHLRLEPNEQVELAPVQLLGTKRPLMMTLEQRNKEARSSSVVSAVHAQTVGPEASVPA
jgi:cytochrome P450